MIFPFVNILPSWIERVGPLKVLPLPLGTLVNTHCTLTYKTLAIYWFFNTSSKLLYSLSLSLSCGTQDLLSQPETEPCPLQWKHGVLITGLPVSSVPHFCNCFSYIRECVPLTLLVCWWECKMVQLLWKTVWRFLKRLKTELSYDPAIPFFSIYLEKTLIWKDTQSPLFIAALFSQDTEAT